MDEKGPRRGGAALLSGERAQSTEIRLRGFALMCNVSTFHKSVNTVSILAISSPEPAPFPPRCCALIVTESLTINRRVLHTPIRTR
jgi:hypothetical protein